MRSRRLSKTLTGFAGFPLGNLGNVILITLSLGLLAVSSFKPVVLSGFRGQVTDLMAPVLNFVNTPMRVFSDFVRDVSGLTQLRVENTRLQAENDLLRDWYQTAMVLKTENTALRDLMKVKADPRHRFITARILSDAGNTFVKSALIEAGLQDNVQSGNTVLASKGVIGRVIEAGDHTARVLLLTDINSRVPVLIGDTLQHAVLAGQNESQPLLLYLPSNVEIEEGVPVITSGHGGVFPEGLPVGTVYKDDSGSYRVQIYADLKSTLYVQVIERNDDPNLQRAVTQ